MAMNDAVLQRSMFNGPRSMAPPSANVGGGIGSMTTPDQNAQALRNMFRAPPSMVMQAPAMQPVQSFQTGGPVERLEITPPPDLPVERLEITPPPELAVEPVASEAPPAPPAPPRAMPTAAPVSAETPREYPIREGIRSLMNWAFPPRQAAAAPTPPASPPPAAVPQLPPPVEVGAAPGMREPPPSSVSVPSLSTSLEEIRAAREAKDQARTAAEKRENALLALMQAGFATAAGTSPYALANIGAGGQAGIGAFANLERGRREDEASRRRETLQRELVAAQLQKDPDQIRTIAMMGGWTPEQGREGLQAAITKGMQIQKSMEKEPETIQLYRILGNGDVNRGFQIFSADKRLQAAIAVTKDITATDEDKRTANDYIRNQLTQSRTAGGGAFPGFSATPVR